MKTKISFYASVCISMSNTSERTPKLGEYMQKDFANFTEYVEGISYSPKKL